MPPPQSRWGGSPGMWEGCLPGGSGPRSLTGSSIIVMRAPPPQPGAHSCGAGAEAAGGGRREQGGRRAACLGLAVCVFARVRACVHACVYCEEACSPMEAGPGAEKLQPRTPQRQLRQLRGLTGPGRGWPQAGRQMARPRLMAPLSARPLGPPTRHWGTSSWPSSSSSCRCNSCSSSTCSTCRDRGWSACSPTKPRGPSRPSRKVSGPPLSWTQPHSPHCTRGLAAPAPGARSGVPASLPLPLSHSSRVPIGPTPAVEGRGCPRAARRGQRQAGGAGPHRHGHHRYLVRRRPQSLTPPLPPHPAQRTAHCAHTSERQVRGPGSEGVLLTCLRAHLDPEEGSRGGGWSSGTWKFTPLPGHAHCAQPLENPY